MQSGTAALAGLIEELRAANKAADEAFIRLRDGLVDLQNYIVRVWLRSSSEYYGVVATRHAGSHEEWRNVVGPTEALPLKLNPLVGIVKSYGFLKRKDRYSFELSGDRHSSRISAYVVLMIPNSRREYRLIVDAIHIEKLDKFPKQ